MTPAEQSAATREICMRAPVIPVLVIKDPNKALPLAKALIRGGLPVLEVTLRTPKAIEVIRDIADIEGGTVGVGTLLTAADVKAAKAAGALFGVSPGLTHNLAKACADEKLPLLPGTATATEVMQALEWGYDMVKFFPAEASGGVQALKAFAGPLPQVSFCPTGGINPQNAPGYLELKNVPCVGGSWIAPDAMIESEDWDGIEALARQAVKLARG